MRNFSWKSIKDLVLTFTHERACVPYWCWGINPMGIPTMREFTNAFEKELEKDSLEKFVVQGIKEYFGDEEWDIENFLLLLRSSLSIERNKAFNLLELKYSRKYQQFVRFSKHHYEKILEKLLSFIRQKCMRYNRNKAAELYNNILDSSSYLTLQVFTTNYDCIIEETCITKGIEFADGFIPNPSGGPIWEGKTLGTSNEVNLYKLHGSVSWYVDKNKKEIFKEPRDLRPTEEIGTIMIYPGETKEILLSPYIELFSEFIRVLYRTNYWVVIGSSLRDDYLRNLLRTRLARGNFQLTLVSPDANLTKKAVFNNNENVRVVQKYFEEYVEDIIT